MDVLAVDSKGLGVVGSGGWRPTGRRLVVLPALLLLLMGVGMSPLRVSLVHGRMLLVLLVRRRLLWRVLR